MSQSHPTLEDLPDELLMIVIDHVPLPSLPHLNLTNKRLNRLCTPKIYHAFSSRVGGATRRIALICSDTGLAHLIKEIHWMFKREYHHASWDKSYILHVSTITSRLRAEESTFARSLADKIEGDERPVKYDNHFLSALLMYTPNIERLQIDDRGLSRKPLLSWMEPIRLGVLHNFQNLRSFTLQKALEGWRDGFISLKDLQPLFFVPSLRKLTFEQVSPEFWNDEGLEEAGRVSNIDQIHIRDCESDMWAICSILGSLRALETFDYRSWNGEWDRKNGIPSAHHGLWNALILHKNTVRNITIHEYESLEEVPELLEKLSTFRALRSLTVPLWFLYTSKTKPSRLCELLPSSLRVLQFIVSNESEAASLDVAQMLLYLATEGRFQLPELGLVKIRHDPECKMVEVLGGVDLSGLFRANGLSLSIYPLYHGYL